MAKKLSTIVFGSSDTTGIVQEDGTLVAAGHLAVTDSDPNASLNWTVSKGGVGTYGTLILAQDGTWSYILNDTSAKVQALAAGQSVTETFAVKVVDSNGASATQMVTITLIGAEDAPVIAFAAGADHGSLQEDVVLKASGTLVGHDVDSGTALSWSVLGGGVGQYGTLTVTQSGKWSYALANGSEAVQSLAAGEHAGESFTVQVSDGQGGFASQVVTLDISGRNDAPVIVASASQLTGGVKEDAVLTAQGQIVAIDIDHGAKLAYAVQGGGIGKYGTLGIDDTGHWTYLLNNGTAKVQALTALDVRTETFKIQVSDGQGGSATKSVTISVSGSDETSGGVTLQAVADSATTGENTPVTVNVLANDTGTGLVLTSATVPTGSGSLAVVNNQLVFDPGTAFDHLAQGATATVVGSYSLHDAANATASASINITVTGSNDAPIVAGPLSVGAVEDAAAVSLDLLTGATDVDDGALLHVANVAALPAGVSLLGSTLTIDPADASFQALAQGETRTLTINYDVVDQFGAAAAQSVTVTVTGANDGPVVAAALTAAATEDAAPITIDLLGGASDVDHGAVLAVANVAALPAGLSLLGSTLTIDPADASFQALAQGETRTLTVNYDVVDQFGAAAAQSVTVTVTGTNDGPVVAAALVATAKQGDAAFSIDLLAGANDQDSLDVLHVTNVTGLGAGMTVLGDVLTIDPSDTAYANLVAGQHVPTQVTFDVADGHGGVVAQSVAIDIAGVVAPPPPVLTLLGDLNGAVTEAANQPDGSVLPGIPTTTGQVHVEGGDPTMVWVFAPAGGLQGAPAAGAYGTLQVDPATGTWTYSLDNSLADTLPAGTVVQDTLSIVATNQVGDVVMHDVVIAVTGANDAPVAGPDYGYGTNTAPTVIDPLADGVAIDPDAGDQLVLTAASVASGYGGSVSIVAGQLVYDPGADYASLGAGNITDVLLNYTVTDQAGLSATSQVSVQLVGQNTSYVPGGTYGPFTVIDPSQATAQGGSIAAAVLGAAPQGLAFDPGTLHLTAGSSSAMYYDGSLAALGIGPGLLITTGTVPGTTNTAAWFGQDNGMVGNPLLDAVVNSVFSTQSYDATMLSFDFTVTDPTVTGINFKAVFGTDEFPEWVDQFVDIAVVMVNGTNVALFNNDPGAPLSVIGSNLAANYFVDNTGNLDPATGLATPGLPSLFPIEYDGVSHLLNISAPVHLGVNTITIGIADTGDHIYDSGLFISSLVASTTPTGGSGGVSLGVTGTDSADVLTGTIAAETIDAKNGNDIIDAGGGNDTVLAGGGDDIVTGGAGNDFIDGGTGDNTAVFSGNRIDYYVAQLANGDFTVEDLRNFAPDGKDELVNVQHLQFKDGTFAATDFLTVTPPPSAGAVINGTAGDDIISAVQTVPGQPAVTNSGDTIHGGGGDDIVTGGAGDDSIFGDAGNDQLRGGAGNDRLDGGEGHDELTGGSGADVFCFDALGNSPPSGMDQITDFSHADGDRIDLTAIVGLHFAAGATGFSGSAGELISVKATDGYLLEADTNGDAQADFAVKVITATKLITTDFLL